VARTKKRDSTATIQPDRKALSEADSLRQLEREGLLRPNANAGVIRDSWKPLHLKGVSMSKTLRRLRDE
jgi:hypothetical protein